MEAKIEMPIMSGTKKKHTEASHACTLYTLSEPKVHDSTLIKVERHLAYFRPLENLVQPLLNDLAISYEGGPSLPSLPVLGYRQNSRCMILLLLRSCLCE